MKFGLNLAFALASLLMTSPVMAGEEFDPQKKKKMAEEPAVIITNPEGNGSEIIIEFWKGKSHNYPLLAIWVEDEEGNYIQTLYVSQSIATSVFRHGQAGWGHWDEAVVRRPASLPYWAHQRGIKADDGLYLPSPENPVPDAYTGATPTSDFILQTRADGKLPQQFRILMEINQAWDWNNYWTNNKYPDDKDYKTSSQPALVYESIVNTASGQKEFEMKPIGHSHYSGKDGELYTELSTFTTALNIVGKVIVRLP
ncbi:MAG: hypothetical protein IH597_15170 [Bacteroidales bacterium]|nr:hypothetical protein [Bacteroidales bacterium]